MCAGAEHHGVHLCFGVNICYSQPSPLVRIRVHGWLMVHWSPTRIIPHARHRKVPDGAMDVGGR